jgi:hypothetical protein
MIVFFGLKCQLVNHVNMAETYWRESVISTKMEIEDIHMHKTTTKCSQYFYSLVSVLSNLLPPIDQILLLCEAPICLIFYIAPNI